MWLKKNKSDKVEYFFGGYVDRDVEGLDLMDFVLFVDVENIVVEVLFFINCY